MTSSPELGERGRCCCGIKGWLLVWTLLLVAEVALLANNAMLDTLSWRTTRWVLGDQDAYSWEKTRAAHAGESDAQFYYHVDPPLSSRAYKRTEPYWRVLRDLGEPAVTIILFVAVCLYDQRRRWRAGIVLATAAISAGLLGTLIRIITGRLRPNGQMAAQLFNEGDNYWELFRSFPEGRDLSFPSGHATLAFATAAALSYLSPRGRGLFIAIAAGTALSRVVMQAHFYSDVLFGSVLGWTVGWFVAKGLDRILAPKAAEADAAVMAASQ